MRADIGAIPEVVSVKRSSALYSAHAYLTKIPVEAIVPFIDNLTEPGDLIIDPFAGSGMTGVAALLTGRRAIVSDISRLGQHIGRNYWRIVAARTLRLLGDKIIRTCLSQYGDDYETICPRCGKTGEIHRLVWSEVFACPKCGADVNFYDAVYDPLTKAKRRSPACPNGHPFVKRNSKRVAERPVEVHYTCSCSSIILERAVEPADLAKIFAIDGRSIVHWWPDIAFDPETEMYSRCALEKNERTRLSDFFSHRNLNMLACLLASIAQVEDAEYREKLRFAFTAILGRASKRYQWGPKRPLNAQNQTYYIAPVFYEWNVLDLFQRKLDAVIDAMQVLSQNEQAAQATLWDGQAYAPQVEYCLSSAHHLTHLANASVDYVFTDPPFGSNIFYSDMNFFAEAWLDEFTDAHHEAVVYTTTRSRKTLREYEVLLTQAFREVYRVLKPGAWASVVFSSSRGDVWRTFQLAVREAGFILEDTHIAILDKGQRSVKGLASDTEHVVTVDLILTLHKSSDGLPQPANAAQPLTNLDSTVDQVFARRLKTARLGNKELSTSYLYLAVIQDCFHKHINVETVNMEAVVKALHRLGYRLDERTKRWLPPVSIKLVMPVRAADS